MSKHFMFLFFIISLTFSVFGMRRFDDGPGCQSDDTIDTYFREEIYGFQDKRLITKPLHDVDEKLSEQVIMSQDNVVGAFVNKLRNFKELDTPMSLAIFLGSSGCGKSTLARYIPQKYGWNCFFLKSGLVSTEFKSSGSQNLLIIFESLLKAKSPTVLIMDEINMITNKFGKSNDTDSDMVGTLWSYLDDCKQNENILCILTTNDYDGLPDAFKTRSARGLFKFKESSFSERKNIIKFYLGSHNGLSNFELSRLAFWWEGQSGREIGGYIEEVVSDKQDEILNLYPNKSKSDFLIKFNDITEKGLHMKWPRCSKLQSTLHEHYMATAFGGSALLALGMYWLQYNQNVSFRLEDMNIRRYEGAIDALSSLNPVRIILETLRKDSQMGVVVKETFRLDDPEVVKNIKNLSLDALTEYLLVRIPTPTVPSPNLNILRWTILLGRALSRALL